MSPYLLSVLFAACRPLSPLYSAAMVIRESLYQRGLLRTRRLPCPVVSVGNLSLGGTGKTPLVIALAEWYRSQKTSPAVLTRGYGSTAGKGPLVVTDGDRIFTSPREAGDEAFMMAETLKGVPVIAGSCRFASGLLAVERFGARVLILDDGFQHMRLARSVDLVLLPARDPFLGGRVFPGGPLREPVSALRRASALILTKAEDPTQTERARKTVHAAFPNIPVFSSATAPSALVSLAGEMHPLSHLSGLRILAFTGLADPAPFYRDLERLGARILERRSFPDHHPYTEADMERLRRKARAAGAQALVTTAKDRVKILPLEKPSGSAPPILVLEVKSLPEQGLFAFLARRQWMTPLR
ncbi:MAG: tetraacyldisaccharide 4'-kinase [Deltaproteobacteria bacterium]